MESVFTALMYIALPLFLGYGTQILLPRIAPSAFRTLTVWVDKVKQLLVAFMMPVVQLLAFWIFAVSDVTMLSLPLVGASSLLIGGVAGLYLGRAIGLPKEQRGSLFLSSVMSNLLSFGGLIAFLLYGEVGFALALLYRAFEPIVYYGVAYPLAGFMVGGVSPSLRGVLKSLAKQPLALLPMAGIVLGLLLQWAGVPRPAVFGSINANLILASAFVLIFSIGLSLRPANVVRYKAACSAVSAVKFVVTPVWVALVCLLLGYARTPDLPILQVALIMSAMPVAMTSIIPTSLFGFDEDLTGSAWLVTTFVSLPLISLVAWTLKLPAL